MHQGISLMCHCEGALRPWQSREGTHVDRTRHCRGAACRSRRCTGVINRLSAKRRTPKVCHCEGALRPWQSREGTYVDRTRHCRGAACPSRRCTGVINRLSAKRRTPKVCHCEEAAGRRGNLAVPCWITSEPRQKRNRLQEIPTSLRSSE